jgi:hypothetical protein
MNHGIDLPDTGQVETVSNRVPEYLVVASGTPDQPGNPVAT